MKAKIMRGDFDVDDDGGGAGSGDIVADCFA